MEIGTINYLKSVGILPFKMKSPNEDSTGMLFWYLVKLTADICYRVYLHTEIILPLNTPIEDSTGILFSYLIKVTADICYRVYLHTEII